MEENIKGERKKEEKQRRERRDKGEVKMRTESFLVTVGSHAELTEHLTSTKTTLNLSLEDSA